MARYLLSALITPFPASDIEAVFKLRRLSLDEAKRWVSQGFTSAIGHESTAQLLSNLLGVSVTPNRVQVWMQPGDEALCVQFLVRFSEGHVADLQELQQLYQQGKIQFVLVQRIS